MRVVLITGTAGGQGAAAAELFREAGATVVGCDLKAAESRPGRGASSTFHAQGGLCRVRNIAAIPHVGIDHLVNLNGRLVP